MFNSRQFYNVNRASVLTPQVRAIWDNMCIGVAVVDADGIYEYMNHIQRRADGFTRIPVEGQHITSLYVPHELEVIPTMECLQTGKPLLKKAYWYATSTNFLASTVTDFFPLFDHGRTASSPSPSGRATPPTFRSRAAPSSPATRTRPTATTPSPASWAGTKPCRNASMKPAPRPPAPRRS